MALGHDFRFYLFVVFFLLSTSPFRSPEPTEQVKVQCPCIFQNENLQAVDE